MHTGGSISLQDHAIRLLEELGRSVYVDEVFQQTHLRKDTEFEARLSQARSDAASSVGKSQLTPLDPAEEQRLRSRVRDAFMVLETLLILTNEEVTASSSTRKDLPGALKMLQRLTA
ncbi:hypothetical protein GmHk_09G025989 [Glycine max]|nr:hypothetical protein GmHk_09G025989 [Glycine max]